MAVMTSAAFYRGEAERARAAAANSKDPETVLRWLRIAKDYHALADAMEAKERKLSGVPPPFGQPQQQPLQQQQAKLGTDEPAEC